MNKIDLTHLACSVLSMLAGGTIACCNSLYRRAPFSQSWGALRNLLSQVGKEKVRFRWKRWSFLYCLPSSSINGRTGDADGHDNYSHAHHLHPWDDYWRYVSPPSVYSPLSTGQLCTLILRELCSRESIQQCVEILQRGGKTKSTHR